MKVHSRRDFIKATTGSTIGVSLLAGCLDGNASFPPSTFMILNAYSEGGGVDTNMREIQPYFEAELDAHFDIEYRDGAGTRIAANMVNENSDLTSIGGILSPATPAVIAIDEVDKGQDPDFTLDDLRPIGTLSEEAAVVRVREDEDRFTTIEELVDYAAANPGALTVGASGRPTGTFFRPSS